MSVFVWGCGGGVSVYVSVRVCVWGGGGRGSVVSVIVQCPVLPPCAVDGRSRNPLYYYFKISLFRILSLHLIVINTAQVFATRMTASVRQNTGHQHTTTKRDT